MAIPNLSADVEAAKQKYPDAWRNAHTGNAQTEDFIRLCARDIQAKHGARWGLNGKRGNPNDISDDILAYSGEGTAVDVVNGGPMEIIDVIAGAGGPNPQVVWNVGPGGPGDKGTFVGTFSVPGGGTGGGGTPQPTPTPSPDPSAHIPKPPPPYVGDHVGVAIGEVLFADYAEAGQPPNPGMGVWFARVSHDAVVQQLGVQASVAKHRAEWRRLLGLPTL